MSMPETEGVRTHIKALTGLRAFAALWVFFLHACFGASNDFPYIPAFDGRLDWGFLEPFIAQGQYAVDLFFILSGFVMAHIYGATFRSGLSGAMSFYRKRLARIYPVHLFMTVVLMAAFAAGLWTPAAPVTWTKFWESVALVNVWGNPSLNMPAWSVSAEWFIYLAAPFILYATGRAKDVNKQLIAVFLLAVVYPFILVLFLCCDWHVGAAALLRVVCGFIQGALLYNVFCSAERLAPRGRHGADLMCAAAFAALFYALAVEAAPFVVYPILPAIVFYLARARTFMAAAFSSRAAVYLGVISYSLYMVHYPVLEVAGHFFDARFAEAGQGVLWLFMAGMTVGLIAAATLCYHFVEEPCRRWMVRRG